MPTAAQRLAAFTGSLAFRDIPTDVVELEPARPLRQPFRRRRHHTLHSVSVPGNAGAASGASRL